jgi:hypothetical protein
MYDYEYEYDVLSLLRILKYLDLYQPSSFDHTINFFGEIDLESVEEIIYNAMWEVFEVSYFDLDEESEMDVVVVQDSEFDRFLSLDQQWYQRFSASAIGVGQKKFQDMVEYYLCSMTHSIFDMRYEFSEDGVKLRLWLSPDCFETEVLANALVDLMLAIRKETELLESLLSPADKMITFQNEPRKEAA